MQCNIFLGHKDTHVTRTGETEMIEIECNEHTLLTSFEVLELQYPFVIGMDLFCKLGFLEESQMDELMLTCSQLPDQNQETYPLRPSRGTHRQFKTNKKKPIFSDSFKKPSPTATTYHRPVTAPCPKWWYILKYQRGLIRGNDHEYLLIVNHTSLTNRSRSGRRTK